MIGQWSSKRKNLISGLSDTGMVRENNEDYFLINPERNLFIVADGMGGHKAGEVASKNATEYLDKYFTKHDLASELSDTADIEKEMVSALQKANRHVYDLSLSSGQYKGMGCTVAYGLRIVDTLHVCHVGDARAYVLSGNILSALTTDHSQVMSLVKTGKMTMEEARNSSLKNELTRAVGVRKEVSPDYISIKLNDGDRVLFCSDGLWDMLSDEEIQNVLTKKTSAKSICEELINKANNAGGKDNISAIVMINR